MDTKNLETRVTSILVDYLTDQNKILATAKEDTKDKIRDNIRELYLTIEDNFKNDIYYNETLKRLKVEPEDKNRQSALEMVLKEAIDINITLKKNLGDLLAKIEGEPDYFVFFSCRHVDRCTRFNKNPTKDECQRNTDELPCYYKNEIKKSIMEKYLFNWDDISENDYNKLRWFLTENAGIDWVKAAKIEKINGQSIKISNTKNQLFLRINDEKTMVKMQLDDGRTETFVVKKENNKLKIYKKNRIDIKFLSRDFKSMDDALEKMGSKNGKNCLYVLNSHRPINELTYFQLGYAFAKGIEILRLNDGLEQFLPDDVKLSSKIYQTQNFYDFIAKILEFSEKKEIEDRECQKNYWNRQQGCWPTKYDNGNLHIPSKN